MIYYIGKNSLYPVHPVQTVLFYLYKITEYSGEGDVLLLQKYKIISFTC